MCVIVDKDKQLQLRNLELIERELYLSCGYGDCWLSSGSTRPIVHDAKFTANGSSTMLSIITKRGKILWSEAWGLSLATRGAPSGGFGLGIGSVFGLVGGAGFGLVWWPDWGLVSGWGGGVWRWVWVWAWEVGGPYRFGPNEGRGPTSYRGFKGRVGGSSSELGAPRLPEFWGWGGCHGCGEGCLGLGGRGGWGARLRRLGVGRALAA
ncbi:hypothetical protein TIFTF001_012279 [Ficus carica]|uniref:Uncharacterized protein n=1 Tax=Ficus carica TaxID=3494 RepID=A0AA88AFM1_FICCA|nr:hypothetical protein TIFTF001_012279 [Ficus carica]